ncbi:uroplakin-3b-like, partial [Chelydra serpentina]
VITTILSILLAILLACFIAALVYGCSSDISESAEIMGKQDPVTVKRYNTHHIYNQPAFSN